MQAPSQARAAILSRLAQLEAELKRVRTELKSLRNHDPTTAEVVTRGAKLCAERSGLERRLEVLHWNSTPPQAVSASTLGVVAK